MHLDKERVTETFRQYSARYSDLERALAEQCGGINWRSPKQVASYLYDTLGFSELKDRRGEPKRTSKGLRLANKHVFSALRPSTDAQRDFISLKQDIGKVGSALDKSLRYFKEVCDERDGTLFAQFNQTITATHRLSSTGIKSESGRSVQFQNLPRDFKGLFCAKRDGWLIGEADGSQLEFRVAAYLGQDEQAKRDIEDGDIHLVSGAYLADTTYEELKARYDSGDKLAIKTRQEAKAETFKPLYGGSKGTKAQERWYVGFRERYPSLAETQRNWELEVARTNELVTPWGLRFYWPNASFRYNGKLNCRTAVYNYPIQALATAEIIPIAVTYFWHNVRVLGLSEFIVPINTVHDSLVAEIHPDYVEQFTGLAREAFGPCVHNYLKSVYGMDFNVPLGVSTKVGAHWGEGEEQKFEYYG
jgi:DNA polymerase I-like protein with 3'-5' exonuclease and polymerase domains